MNILLSIHHEMNINAGAPGVTYQLSRQYERLGHQVSLFSYNDLPSYIPAKLKGLVFPYYLMRRIKKSDPFDIVDASSGDAWLWSLFRRKDREEPALVTRSHGLEHTMHIGLLEEQKRGNVKLSWKYPLYHGGLRLWEVAVSFRKADGSLFLNQQDYEYAIHKLRVKQASSRLVRNGLPDYFLNLSIDNVPVIAGAPIRIAQVGSYILRKGIAYTAEAMNVILKEYPNAEMSFIGTGCSRETVLADYDAAVHSRIHVIPAYRHEELPSILMGHQIKLFPTLSEGYPLSLLEAMACGLVPISSFTTSSFLQDGKDALLIPMRESSAIKSKLRQLLDVPSQLQSMQRNAYETAQTHDWSQIASETIQFYKELCGVTTG
ncbi:glycosyltransferase family 4 protein [Paenibacillus lupini]|uniref:glycosyltransferase family 4 protein n=1 Tax=Paenibacillus lupini TaxID=1450204 RepID=UPI001423B490|nr:glycosyltransferase family 4 protein [Paenibacillus lupini]NIK26284.1 glycosyltransferase involved in cell wall biosynthesis [Paenibacillus lupini]